MRRCRHRYHGDQHQRHRELEDGPELASELSQRGGGRGSVEQGRDEEQENDIWVERRPREPGCERDERAAEYEKSRVGHSEALPHRPQGYAGAQEYQNQLDVRHAPIPGSRLPLPDRQCRGCQARAA